MKEKTSKHTGEEWVTPGTEDHSETHRGGCGTTHIITKEEGLDSIRE